MKTIINYILTKKINYNLSKMNYYPTIEKTIMEIEKTTLN